MSQKRPDTEFYILGQPVSCPRPRVTSRGVFYPKKYREAKKRYTSAIRLHFLPNGIKPFIGPVSLHLEFIHKRPKALKGTGREWKITRPDLDNLVKTIKDALSSGGAWIDDSQCCVLYASDFYGSPNEDPHTKITMSSISEEPSQ